MPANWQNSAVATGLEKVSFHRVLLKSGPGNRGRSACGPTHVACLEFPRVGKDSDAGRDWGQEEKGMTENEMAGWHHWLNRHEFE